MKLGIYGGTFDPIHLGHLVLAEQCREQCRLDEVWFVPALEPPHKLRKQPTAARQRVEMLKLAVAGMPYFKVSDVELKRTGPSYTVDTLQEIHAEHNTSSDPCELFLLIGADSLHDFPTWREPDRIAELANIVAVNRGDTSLSDIKDWKSVLGDSIYRRIRFVEMPGIDISSTDLRKRSAAGRSLRFLVSRAVEEYIVQHRLYRDDSDDRENESTGTRHAE